MADQTVPKIRASYVPSLSSQPLRLMVKTRPDTAGCHVRHVFLLIQNTLPEGRATLSGLVGSDSFLFEASSGSFKYNYLKALCEKGKTAPQAENSCSAQGDGIADYLLMCEQERLFQQEPIMWRFGNLGHSMRGQGSKLTGESQSI